MKVEIHCAVCSRQGENTGPHSLVARLDLDKLTIPITGEIFESPAPERGLPRPWVGVPPDHMKCPHGHLIWKYQTSNEISEGVLNVVTDHGVLNLNKFTCPQCGKQFKTKRQLHAHSLWHKAEEKRQFSYSQLTPALTGEK